ncbi:MAG: 50S ribosome-binding GTPase [Candidatus Diapherotrites archaeon]|uniref:50S ribosome-binding GTPase n=1 Tax=Candidatus Iainarchaeum sp. TaxID=3101447 RepID=A0A938YUS1_9ARCH|nr:50S ribosome-binding GTPase [Candidatus Diapherotrites archaeon]
MPANVTIEFEKARLEYQQASSPKAKLEALVKMQKFAPSHKGAENLRKDISKKMALVKREIDKHKAKEKKRGGRAGIAVKKEGIGQVALLGMPNSGKSWLLNKLANVNVEVAPYPFTTKKPAVGMMDFRGAKIQLVEVPALVGGSSEGKANGLQLLSIARNADAIVLVVKSNAEKAVLGKELANAKIVLNEKKPAIDIKPSKFKGISIVHKKNLKIRQQELEEFLKKRAMFNVSVILDQELSNLETVERVLDHTITYKKGIAVNPFEEQDWELLKQAIFSMLGKTLVYTKRAGEEPDMEAPLALPLNATVEDAAKQLHKELAGKFRYARVWGSSKYPGQRVQRDYRLQNLDILEICE